MNRRYFMKVGTASLAAGLLASSMPKLFAEEKKILSRVRIGAIGVGSRGTGMMKYLLQMPDVEITALCDINENNLNRALQIVKQSAGNTPASFLGGPYEYKKMLESDNVDGVFIATPAQTHAEMAIDSMNAGKHVGSEVPGGYTSSELWEMVRIKEKTGVHYKLLENYNYMQTKLMIFNMVQQGVFGEPYYAVGSYIHATPKLNFNSDGSLTWRGELRRDAYGNWYPTHAIGPICKWLDINKTDALDYLVCMQNKPVMAHLDTVKQFGQESTQAKIDFKTGEFIQTLIQTKKGKLLQIDFGPVEPRPQQVYYGIQGTKGAFDDRHGIYLGSNTEKWEPLDKYKEKYESHYWKESGQTAGKTGHGGGDYFVMRDFVEMIKQDKEPWIDVYDSAVWSSIFECTQKSLENRSSSVDIPDFTE